MKVFNSYESLRSHLDQLKNNGLSIGFVPTMGALHEGHLSLVSKAKADTDAVVVSIFVNPSQFNNSSDLANYPRTLNADLTLLKASCNCDVVFAPKNKKAVYNELYTPVTIDLNDLDQIMEGTHRPGHFEGVVNVVNQLFKLVQPSHAFFGEKDFQQLAIIRYFVHKMRLPIKIIGCPIKREAHGLAMSSRNERLSAKQRHEAKAIHEALKQIKSDYLRFSMSSCLSNAALYIDSHPELKVEYIQAIDGKTLKQISEWHHSDYVQVCCAVYCGEIRLIDNQLIFKT